MRRLLFSFLYISYLLLVLVAIDYGFYRYGLSRLRPDFTSFGYGKKVPTSIPFSLWNSVGYIITEKKPNRFFLYPVEKSPGKIRIGTFGDSFTYGAEVASGLDFPAQLQNLFRTAGAKNVEVLNFGNSWHGFHQGYRIWEKLGQKYNLDFILLGPGDFFSYRETTFNHTGFDHPEYLHGRYILNFQGGVEFIDVAGGSDLKSRFSEYFSFIPRFDYLRYDINSPPFLRALVLGDHRISNPFYYLNNFGQDEDEIPVIRDILIGNMAKSGSQVILLNSNLELVNRVRRIKSVLAEQIDTMFKYKFPFVRSQHDSSIGYQEIARLYYDVLTGKKRLSHFDIRFHDFEANRAKSIKSLPEFKRALIEINGQNAGTLAHCQFDRSFPVDLSVAKFRSYFAIKGPKESVINSSWIGLEFPISPGDPVSLELGSNSNLKVIPFGTVHFLNSNVGFGYVAVNGYFEEMGGDGKQFLKIPLSENDRKSANEKGVVTVSGRPIYRIKWESDDSFALSPIQDTIYKFKPEENTRIDLSQLPKKSVVNLSLQSEAGIKKFNIGEAETAILKQNFSREGFGKFIEIQKNELAVLRNIAVTKSGSNFQNVLKKD